MIAEPSFRKAETETLLEVRGLSHRYIRRRGLFGGLLEQGALENVDLIIPAGKTAAVVGPSGSGKSTLARCILRLENPCSGEVWFSGRNLLTLSDAEMTAVRRQMQIVFQDTASALNPRLRVSEIIEEPLLVHRIGTKRERGQRAIELMEQVGLSGQWAGRRPLELSGGQRQRVAIARALALEPKFLILDEAFSSLDLSVQAQLANLLLDLQVLHSLTYLLISHDLALVGHLADEVAVLHRGRVVEQGPVTELFTNPRHPETQALLAAVPSVKTASAALFT
ncbi:MAG: ATP-binding cassette domain-containing protein [Candidatus Acidiferrales bacterium]